MKIKDITGVIEKFSPLSIQEGWDNCGLIIGSEDDDVKSVLIGFDCTPELVDEAVRIGANLIITHHPLIFKGVKKIDPEDFVGKTIIKAIRGGVAIYAAHTNADKVISGVSGAMAKRLNLQNIRILDNDGENVGLGIIGELPEPISSKEAIELVKDKFNLKMVKTSKPIDSPIHKIAVCGGSGSSLIEKSYCEGAQLYITGDISYHNFFVHENYMIMDIGHFESEIDIASVFYSLITKKFPNFAIRISENINNSNPIYYF